MGVNRNAVTLYRTYLKTLDWLFPPRCLGCSRRGSHWCESCQASVSGIQSRVCSRCGLPEVKGAECADCREYQPAFDQARAWGRYDAALRPAVVALKYRPDPGLGWLLAQKLAAHPALLDWQVAGIIPVPLAVERQRERGHNQADLLAQPLAMLLGLPTKTNALRRWRDTPKQVGLSPYERRQNMLDAFVAEPDLVKGRSWLLVDDVMTTGATLDAAAAALKDAGAAHVYALTLGRVTL